jgi:hypothetical protein
MFMGVGCSRRSSDGERQEEVNDLRGMGLEMADHSAANSLPEADSEGMWVSVWRRTAAGKGCTQSEIDDVARILADVLECTLEKRADESHSSGIRSAYALSLCNFIDTQYLASPTQSRSGASYWMAFCVVEAACRFSESGTSASDPTFDTILDDICDTMIRPGFRRVLSSSDYEVWSDALELGLADFKRNMGIVITQFQKDVLCPGFRKNEPMTDEVRRKLIRWFEYPGHIPKCEEPESVLASKDGRYKAKLTKFFVVDALNYCLYQLFFQQNMPAIIKNRYWGNMKWGSTSQSVIITETGLLRWPVHVWMTPNSTLNEIEKWERGDDMDNHE